MATVNITVDTSSDGSHGAKFGPHVATAAAADKIGLVSSIQLDRDLLLSFLSGAGVSEGQIESGTADNNNYKAGAIKQVKDDHRNKHCKVIATVGGSVAFDAINADSPANNENFISIVGGIPPTPWNSKLKGGVSLESYNSNVLR